MITALLAALATNRIKYVAIVTDCKGLSTTKTAPHTDTVSKPEPNAELVAAENVSA